VRSEEGCYPCIICSHKSAEVFSAQTGEVLGSLSDERLTVRKHELLFNQPAELIYISNSEDEHVEMKVQK
jgi:hypothetical protein